METLFPDVLFSEVCVYGNYVVVKLDWGWGGEMLNCIFLMCFLLFLLPPLSLFFSLVQLQPLKPTHVLVPLIYAFAYYH